MRITLVLYSIVLLVGCGGQVVDIEPRAASEVVAELHGSEFEPEFSENVAVAGVLGIFADKDDLAFAHYSFLCGGFVQGRYFNLRWAEPPESFWVGIYNGATDRWEFYENESRILLQNAYPYLLLGDDMNFWHVTVLVTDGQQAALDLLWWDGNYPRLSNEQQIIMDTNAAGVYCHFSVHWYEPVDEPIEYAWDFGGAAMPNTSTEAEPVVLLLAAGEYAATVYASNLLGESQLEWTLVVE